MKTSLYQIASEVQSTLEEIDTLLEVEYFYDENDEVKLISVFDCDNNEHMESFIEGFQHNQKFLKEVRTAWVSFTQ